MTPAHLTPRAFLPCHDRPSCTSCYMRRMRAISAVGRARACGVCRSMWRVGCGCVCAGGHLCFLSWSWNAVPGRRSAVCTAPPPSGLSRRHVRSPPRDILMPLVVQRTHARANHRSKREVKHCILHLRPSANVHSLSRPVLPSCLHGSAMSSRAHVAQKYRPPCPTLVTKRDMQLGAW